MNDAEQDQMIDEYYEILTSSEMQPYVQKYHVGLVYARVGGHQYWPARICGLEEWKAMFSHRQKKGQVCVYFFGSHNFGWVKGANMRIFDKKNEPLAIKNGKKVIRSIHYKLGLQEVDDLLASCPEADERLPLSLYDQLLKEKEERRLLVEERKNQPALVQRCNTDSGPFPPAWVNVDDDAAKKDEKKDKMNRKPSPHHQHHQQLALAATSASTSSAQFSEEKCLICSYGGELVVCDFAYCTKVYHRLCLGEYPFPSDESTPWYCPRHSCLVTQETETDSCLLLADENGKRGETTTSLWKCVFCPCAVSKDIMTTKLFRNLRAQQVPKHATLFSTKHRTFVCPNCSLPSPRLQLAKKLEQIWSTMATNHQGLPFYGPLLPGVLSTPRSNSKTRKRNSSSSKPAPVDFIHILQNIRWLKYNSSSEFLCDIESMTASAKTIIGNKSKPLIEAIETIDNEIHTHVLTHCARTLQHIEAQMRPDAAADPRAFPTLPQSSLALTPRKLNTFAKECTTFESWCVPWRRECMLLHGPLLEIVEQRTIAEWTEYIVNTPPPQEPSKKRKRSTSSASTNDPKNSTLELKMQDPVATTRPSSSHLLSNNDSSSTQHLCLDEQMDIASILTDMKAHEPSSARSAFLSPSQIEMKHMFDQQSLLLVRTLEGHAALRRAMEQSNASLFENEGQVLTLGEGRLACELRAANDNLHARLDRKDQLVHSLVRENQSMTRALSKSHMELELVQKRLLDMENRILLATKESEPQVPVNGKRRGRGRPRTQSPARPSSSPRTSVPSTRRSRLSG